MTNDGEDTEGEEINGLVLPRQGIEDLTDKLTEYMTEIELGGLPDILGQVLDDFIDQSGAMPEDLHDPRVFDQITSYQLAVTLAYQLGRLEGRSPQVVRLLIQQAIEKWGTLEISESAVISDADLDNPKEQVFPRLRRLTYGDEDDHDDC